MTFTAMEGFDWLNDWSLTYTTNGNFGTTSVARYAGGKSLELTGASNSYVELPLNTSVVSGTIGVAVNILTMSNGLDLIRLQPSNSLNLTVHAGTSLRLEDADGGTIGSSSNVLTANTWHYIEWKYIMENSITSQMEVLVDGSSVITISPGTDTKSASADSTLTDARLYNNNTARIYYDDFYRTTYNHGTETTYLGGIRVVALHPTSTFSTEWDNSNDAGSNYTFVDETGNPDNDASFVLTTGLNRLDLYHVDNLPAEATSVHGIEVITYARRSGTDPASIAQAIRPNNTTYDMQGETLTTSYQYFRNVTGLDPDTGSPFTTARIDALRIGQRATSFG